MGSLITQVAVTPPSLILSVSVPVTFDGVAVNVLGGGTVVKTSRDIHYNPVTSNFVIDTAGDYYFQWNGNLAKGGAVWPIDVNDFRMIFAGISSAITGACAFNTAAEAIPNALPGCNSGFLFAAIVGQTINFMVEATSSSNAAYTGTISGSVIAYLLN